MPSASVSRALILVLLVCASSLTEGIRHSKVHLRGKTSVSNEKVISPATSSCSGNGIEYPDTGLCECFQCFQGPDCSQTVSPCNVVSEGGNPLVFQEYWEGIGSNHTIDITSYYRTGYQITKPWTPNMSSRGIFKDLDNSIRALHAKVGNVETEGAYIVGGAGCTMLIAAAQYALSKGATGRKIVFSQTPYYDGYANFAKTQINGVSFNASLSVDPTNAIEFVTIPNNPDGTMRQAYFNTSAQVHDMVYNWPSVAATPTQKASFDIMLFSLSKLSGHAGTRFGWAIVKSEDVANDMQEFISAATIALSIESQYRAFTIINAINDNADTFFPYIKNIMTQRWSELQTAWAQQQPANRFSLLSKPQSFYGWVKCNTDADCVSVFSAGGVTGESGVGFGADQTYLRLELVMRSSTWPIFMQNIRKVLGATSAHA